VSGKNKSFSPTPVTRHPTPAFPPLLARLFPKLLSLIAFVDAWCAVVLIGEMVCGALESRGIISGDQSRFVGDTGMPGMQGEGRSETGWERLEVPRV
jgi:hypothetical protein